MGSISIRVSGETHRRLRELARRESRPISAVADEAVRSYEKEQRWQAAEAAMARLRQDSAALAEYEAEAAHWDGTATDGLEDWPYEEPS